MGEEIPEEAAEALLVLIPKEMKPSSLKGLTPLCLCNIVYKPISKTIVNSRRHVNFLYPLFKQASCPAAMLWTMW